MKQSKRDFPMVKRSYSGAISSAKKTRVFSQPVYSMVAPQKTYSVRLRNFAPRRSSAVETKYFDVSFAQAVANAGDWTGTEVPCTNYIQSDGTTVGAYTDSALIPSATGAGYGQVVGSKYTIRKIRVRGLVNLGVLSDQADVPAPRSVRVLLVMDMQPNGAQAQGEDVLTDMGSASACNFSFMAMAAGAGGRFRILKDKWFSIDPAVAGTDGANTNSCAGVVRHFHFSYNPKKAGVVRTKASSSTPTVATLSDKNVFLLAHADGASCSIVGCSRTYYVD